MIQIIKHNDNCTYPLFFCKSMNFVAVNFVWWSFYKTYRFGPILNLIMFTKGNIVKFRTTILPRKIGRESTNAIGRTPSKSQRILRLACAHRIKTRARLQSDFLQTRTTSKRSDFIYLGCSFFPHRSCFLFNL